MKLDSKFFDRLRVKPDENRLLRDACPKCEWQGCLEPGLYPAPKGRGLEGQYYRYCLDHVRAYNKGYNYFSGLPDEEVVKHQKSDATGHRPTWFVGVNSWARNRVARNRGRRGGYAHRFATHDPFGLFGDGAPGGDTPGAPARRPLKRLERKSLRQLNLDDNATQADIKARFKELVKRLHPDHNKGDRGSEDKLREVIQAYNYLRQAGLA
ncbi:MAG: J domain-containing protein [Methyloceanibacter sp.]|uniref:J domain-containing protein n=1 Tax=Methyloceanibacter sp. TaxID=1965321 RepID=UPI003D6C9E5B